MSNKENLTGRKFGRLTVIGREGSGWKCKCSCGCETVVYANDLICGDVKSCGCLRREHQQYFKNVNNAGGTVECMRLTYNGKTLTVTEWAKQAEQEKLGIKRRNIYCRLRRGWGVERALTVPNRRQREFHKPFKPLLKFSPAWT